MELALWLIVACGGLSIVYGVVTTQALLAADAGSARMQEISAAVREGASAYLKRQYTPIAIVGVVILVAAFFLLGIYAGHRLSHRRDALGRGRLHRHERVGAGQCARGPGGHRLAGQGLDSPSSPGAVTGMLVAGLGSSASRSIS